MPTTKIELREKQGVIALPMLCHAVRLPSRSVCSLVESYCLQIEGRKSGLLRYVFGYVREHFWR